MNITPEQAYAIINSPNRLVLEHYSELEVYFTENENDELELFFYDESNDEPVFVASKKKLDNCTWTIDKGEIAAYLGEDCVFIGNVYIMPASELDALVD